MQVPSARERAAVRAVGHGGPLASRGQALVARLRPLSLCVFIFLSVVSAFVVRLPAPQLWRRCPPVGGAQWRPHNRRRQGRFCAWAAKDAPRVLNRS